MGIPADLLRRRPDIRAAEYNAAAQCAQIGVAKAQLYPAFSLSGNFGLLSSDVGKASLADMFNWRNRNGSIGPAVQWNIFNYGQITNLVRVQDARFQQLLITYQNTVLSAQQEVEDNLIAFLRTQEQAAFLRESAEAALRSLDLAVLQYREGITDFTTVLTAQQSLLSAEDSLANAMGNISLNLVGVYRALGGGWEIREGQDFVPAATREQMEKRTNWGNLLTPASEPPPTPAGAAAKAADPGPGLVMLEVQCVQGSKLLRQKHLASKLNRNVLWSWRNDCCKPVFTVETGRLGRVSSGCWSSWPAVNGTSMPRRRPPGHRESGRCASRSPITWNLPAIPRPSIRCNSGPGWRAIWKRSFSRTATW